MDFKPARLDRTSSIVTILTAVLLSALSAVFVIKVPFGWGFAAFSAALMAGCYLFSVRNFRIEAGNLVIEKVVGARKVPMSEIESYMIVDDFLALKPLRAFGNGGLFGYYGIFTAHDYGRMDCYLTSLRQVVMIKTRRGILVLSPEDPGRFVAQIPQHVKVEPGRSEKVPTIMPERIRYASPLVLLLPAAIFCFVLLGAALLYPRLPPYVATHFNFQGVADHWSPRSSIVFMGVMPSAVILALTALLFLAVRKRTPDPRVAYFVAGLLAFIQLFMGFIFIDVFWFNIRQAHMLPLPLLLIVFLAVVAAGTYLYYNTIKKHSN